MQYSTSAHPAGHHLRRSGYAANPGQGTFPNGSPLPNQRTPPAIWSAAPMLTARPALTAEQRRTLEAMRIRAETEVSVLCDLSDGLIRRFDQALNIQELTEPPEEPLVLSGGDGSSWEQAIVIG